MNYEFSILDILKVFIKKWWIFVVTAVVFAVMAVVYTKFFVQPVYVSRGTAYITASSESYSAQGNITLSDLMLSQELTYTYAEVLNSNTYLKSVAKESGLNYDHIQLKNMISIESVEGASVMVVKVRAYDPKEACIIAETFLNGAQEEVGRVIKGGIIEIIDHAEVPVAPSSPSYPRNILLAVIFAFLLVGIIVFCAEYFDDRIKGSQDLSVYNLPVLAEIPFVADGEEKKKKRLLKKAVKVA